MFSVTVSNFSMTRSDLAAFSAKVSVWLRSEQSVLSDIQYPYSNATGRTLAIEQQDAINSSSGRTKENVACVVNDCNHGFRAKA